MARSTDQGLEQSNLEALPPLPKEARGQRIRQLLAKLDISMTRFAKKHGIKPATLGSWEQGNHGGLTSKGALTLVDAFKQEGLNVTFDWLLHGKGLDPLQFRESQGRALNPPDVIVQELQVFHQLNPNAIDAIIPDSSLEPYFSKDDLVAGTRRFGKDIDELIGMVCIVQLADGRVLVRELTAGDEPELYTLKCYHPTTEQPTLKNVKLFSAARVVWHRRHA